MIEPFKIPSDLLEDVFDLEEAFIGLAMKVNEIIEELNRPEPGQDFFQTELLNLINTWKNEATQLEEHPENFPGFSREVCMAIARDKIHCCAELLKLIEEQ